MSSKISRQCHPLLPESKPNQYKYIALFGLLAGIITTMLLIWFSIVYWYIGIIIMTGFLIFWILASWVSCKDVTSEPTSK